MNSTRYVLHEDRESSAAWLWSKWAWNHQYPRGPYTPAFEVLYRTETCDICVDCSPSHTDILAEVRYE